MRDYLLSDEQVSTLQIHYENISRILLSSVDDDFILAPTENANFYMLSHHLIELFHVADNQNLQPICRLMVDALKEKLPIDNPFLGASMAQIGDTDSLQFEAIIQTLLESQLPTGLIHFGAGYLPLGDDFTTLWGLRILALSSKLGLYSEQVNLAINELYRVRSGIMRRSADTVGFLMYVMELLYLDDQSQEPKVNDPRKLEIINECAANLLNLSDIWINNTIDLRQGGFVTYDLLCLQEMKWETTSVVEKWLKSIFDLDNASPTGLPQAFQKSQSDLPLDVWLQGWIRSLITASMYLKIRLPGYIPSASMLVQYFGNFHNVNKELQLVNASVNNIVNAKLNAFQDTAARHRYVFIIQNDSGQHCEEIRTAISDALKDYNLTIRYLGDRPTPYLADDDLNIKVYLRGCKYAVMVYDTFPINLGRIKILPLEMDQDQSEQMILSVIDQEGFSPELPDEVKLLVERCKPFDSSDPNLTLLREAVVKWASTLNPDAI